MSADFRVHRVVSVLLTILFVGGCGGGFAEKEEKPTLRPLDILIDWQAEPTYLGIYYAIDKGYLASLGFDATVTQSWGANQAVTAVASGAYLIGTATGGATILGRNNGAAVTSLAVLYSEVPSVVYGLSGSGIATPADLEGRRIGIYPSSITVNEFDVFMSKNNIDESEVEMISLSGADIPYLISEKVDAVLHYTEMSPVIVETSDNFPGAPGTRTFEFRLSEFGVEGYGLNLIANSDLAVKQKIDVVAVSDALVQGYIDGCANKDEAQDLFVKKFPDKNPAYVKESWSRVCELIGQSPGTQTAGGWQKTIDLYNGLGLLKVDVTPLDIMGDSLG